MHAGFSLEPAVGVVTLHPNRRRLDAGGFAFGLFDPFDLVAMFFGPARVHAQQHARPILTLGAAGAGVHFEIGIVGVGFAREQRLALAAQTFHSQFLDRGFGLRDDVGIFFGLAALDHSELVVKLLLHAGDGRETVFEVGALLHDALGARGVIPQAGVFRLRVQFSETRG